MHTYTHTHTNLQRYASQPIAEYMRKLKPYPLGHVIFEVIVGVSDLFDQRKAKHARMVEFIHDGQGNELFMCVCIISGLT